MDAPFFGTQTSNVKNISNGRIDAISYDNNNAYITVSYSDCIICQQVQQTIRLIADNRTRIYDETGRQIPITALRTGMHIDAAFSNASTRSIPPQALAFMIRIVRRNIFSVTTTGLITDINRRNRSFITISNGNPVSVIQFNLPENALIFDRFGRPTDFNALRQGMRVTVRHASFTTPSIPPQTTAYEVQIR